MDFILPRNEYELCELFEDLFLMKTEKFLSTLGRRDDALFRFSEKGLKIIESSGIINKIFRRWFQTTWGDENWSTHFAGETPRQELSRLYPELNTGSAFLSVDLIKRGSNWAIEPTLDLKRNPPREKEWKLFWKEAGERIVFNIVLDLPNPELTEIAQECQIYLNEFVLGQGCGIDDFLGVDKLTNGFWNIMRRHDRRLLSYENLVSQNERKLSQNAKNPSELYSMLVFFNLGVALDEHLLCPADRYFGCAEMVWTDKMNFLGSFGRTIELANNELKMPPIKGVLENARENPSLKKLIENMEDLNFNIMRLWFAPPTSFRFLDSARQHF